MRRLVCFFISAALTLYGLAYVNKAGSDLPSKEEYFDFVSDKWSEASDVLEDLTERFNDWRNDL